MRKLILASLLALPVFGDQAFQAALSSPSKTATWLMDSTVRALNSFRLEARLKITCPATNNTYQAISLGAYTVNVPQFGIAITKTSTDCQLTTQDYRDTTPTPATVLSLAGRTEIMVRAQRDTVGGQLVATVSEKRHLTEIWNAADASNYAATGTSGDFGKITTATSGLAPNGDVVGIGNSMNVAYDGALVVEVAWVKIHSTILPVGSAPPKASDTADIANWQLEGTGADTSGNGRNLTLNNSPTFVTSADIVASLPRTADAPSWTTWVAQRAGFPATLSGTQSYSDETNGAITHTWVQISGPSTLLWTGQQTATPSVSGLIAGTYLVRQCITSFAGRVGCTDLQFGAVATDSNGIVVTDANALVLLNAERIRFGASPWPYQDDRQKYMAEFFAERQTSRYVPRWRTHLTGTVSATNGSTTVTGTGTDFTTSLLCTGGADASDFIAIRYPDANVQGGYRYRAGNVASCTATSITLFAAWDGPTVSGAAFGKFTQQDYGYWNGGGDNANYYDNVLAFYDLYHRSGNTQYRDWARELADRFIEAPLNDYFGSNGGGGRWYAMAPRVRALSGLMMRALDGRSDFWPLIYSNVFVNQGDSAGGATYGDFYSFGGTISTGGFFNRDPREEAYAMAHAAQMSRLYPLDLPDAATRRAALVSHVNHMLANRFAIAKRSDGSQRNYYTDRILGTAKVTNGDTAVTGTGFTADACASPKTIWFVRSWLNADQDTATYTCTYNSSTSITLGSPYTGTTETVGNKSWTAELINGPPTQPFMQGIVASGFLAASRAISAGANKTFAETHIADTINWQITYGYRASSKGIYYLRSAANCEPDPEVVQRNGTTWCVAEADGDGATREYAAEILGGFAWGALLDPGNTALLTRGDIHAGAMFGRAGYGGPQTSDGYYGGSLTVESTRNGKYFGFYFGYGATSAWPAARLGGIAPVDTKTVRLSYTAPGGTSATSATYVAPSGASSTISCSGGNCDLPTDWRQGNYLYKLTHTVSGGTVAGDLMPLRLQ